MVICLLILSSSALFWAVSERASRELAAERRIEQELRAAALERADEQNAMNTLDQLASLGVGHQAPHIVLENLAELTSATPNNSFWTRISFDKQNYRIDLLASDATTSLQNMQTKLRLWEVKLVGAIRPNADGKETLSLLLSPAAPSTVPSDAP